MANAYAFLGSADRIFVDGHNLALRCANVRALGRLQDKRGRSTGVLHGFLRTIQSFQKAAPWATVTVAWDGSSKRRKALFDGYKANRPAPNHPGQDSHDIAWLKQTLPLMSVKQAWNDQEECDDVIATMVHNRPANRWRDVIVSTDRDFLQLVDASANAFAPAPTSISGKGKLYDYAKVVQDYGVSPSNMVLLRAMAGDVSDDIPGAEGVGPKIAARAIQLVAEKFAPDESGPITVNRLYADLHNGKLKLTKLQATRLRDAEYVVRRNVELMTLLSNIDLHTIDPAPNEEALISKLREHDLESIAATTKKKSASKR
jgi:5'-3' exonuclease